MSSVMKRHVSAAPHQKPNQADIDLYNLFTGKENGHVSHYVYLNGGADDLAKFYSTQRSYYPNFGEIEFLDAQAKAISAPFADTRRLIIVGPGPAKESLSRKEMSLIPHLPNLESVHLIDVSQRFCQDGKKFLSGYFNSVGRQVDIHTTVADYRTASIDMAKTKHDNTTVISTGSLLSNVNQKPSESFPDHQLEEFLLAMRNITGKGKNNRVVIGYDACQDEQQVLEAYEGPLFDRVILGALKHAFARSASISGLSPDQVDKYFKRTSIWQPSVARHNVEVTRPCQLLFHQGNQHNNVVVPLRRGQQFTIVNAVKPPEQKIRALGNNVGMKTEITLGSRHGLVEHVFSLTK